MSSMQVPTGPARARTGRGVVGWGVAALALAVVLWATQRQVIWWMADWRVYDVAVRAVLDGDGRLYDVTAPPLSAELRFAAPFNYPPFAALVLLPFAVLPWDVLAVVWTALKLVALGLVVARCLDALRVDRARRRWVLPAFLAGLLLVDPVFTDVQVGNINTFLLALVVLDLTRPVGARGRGALVGLAAAIKITPGFFVLYLLVTRQYRAAGWAAAGLGTVAVGAAVLPRDSWRYWTDVVVRPERVFAPQFTHNQSLRGVLVRLQGTAEQNLGWLLLAVVVGLLGLALAVGLHRRGEEIAAITVCGVVTALVSPFSWNHHWIWLVPGLVLLWVVAARRRSGAVWAVTAVVTLIFLTRPYLFATFDPIDGFGLGPVAQLLAASYVLTGLALLALAEGHRRASVAHPAAYRAPVDGKEGVSR
ncbi:hypothetical protein AWW66_01110 [Micromonospora rosaria]|uniref:Alpha-1,2-mannosyltransferase n=1 Tax=Micromonospora rosaria TaxID=47874 RepID=A0A136PZD6_9ACTN|nr:glycosyltransferase 87 family protein [Micromonospora rosaria]KXK63810.1 hypothetical protein AWW66_01110 [Micromonospora rosaria]